MSPEPTQSPAPGSVFSAVVTHPVAVTMVFLAAMVFGWVSYQRLPIELMPDIAYPTVTVRTTYEGAAPQEVESQISRPIEESLATLDGLVSIESRSRAGGSDVILGFDWGTDMGAATQAIRENLQIAWLPTEADRPLILRYDPSLDPFLRLALAVDTDAADAPEGEAALYLLREIGDNEVKRALEAIEGVAAVRAQGGLEKEIRIEVREDWMAARSITLDQVRAALQSENVNIAGGSILEGDVEYLIRTLNEYSTLSELESLRIRRTDGVLVPLTDVAILTEGHKERQVVSRLDGGEAVELEVFKEADANVVDVAWRVRELLEGDGMPAEFGGKPGLTKTMPPGVTLTVLDNQAEFIESAVTNLRDTAALGGFFAVGVLFLFLRDFRATAIIGLAIPMSVIIGFAPLYLQEISLNLMSLGGLALGVGMLVDNAVVVLESIQRYREEGFDREQSAVKGTADVAAAVTASTLTTVAVFAPISFVEGVAGELFGDLSLAVVSSLMASLAVALFAVPMLAARDPYAWLQTSAHSSAALLNRQEGQSLGTWIGALLGGASRRIFDDPVAELKESVAWSQEKVWRLAALPWSLSRFALHVSVRGTMVCTSLGLAVVAKLVLWLGSKLLAPLGRFAMWVADRFNARYDRFARRYEGTLGRVLSRPGLVLSTAGLLFVGSLAGTGLLGSELIPELHQGRFTAELALPVGTPLPRTARVVSDAEQIAAEHPEVALVYSTVGVDQRADARSDEGEHTARLRIRLTPGGDLAEREARVMEELRVQLSEIDGLAVKMARPALFSTRTPVEVVLFGWELDRLRDAGDIVVDELTEVSGLRDVRSSLVRGHPEVRIEYDRARLHRLGLDAATVAAQVRDKVQGVEATQIQQTEQRIPLRVQLIERDRGTIEELGSINVNPQLMPVIPLSSVADLVEDVGPSEIRRVDQQRAVVVSANLEGFDLGSAVGGIDAAMMRANLPDGIVWNVAGQSREMQQSLGSLQFALGLAVFLVYVIMASTFENIVHPFVILFSVPLAIVGAVFGLAVAGSPISVVVLIGAIVLAGVVVNNAIVLVDTINRQRSEGLERDAAIRKAAAMRLRPILITTATTVLGLFPLALGFGSGAEMQSPLAVTVIGGLLSSTLLTLGVIPVVYRVMNRTPSPDPAPDLTGDEVVP